MGFGKFLPFLALGILILYQVGVLEAAPPRSTLDEKILNRLVKEVLKRMANDKDQDAMYTSDTTIRKGCNTGTCLTNKLAMLLNKSRSTTRSKLLPPTLFNKG